LTRDLVTHIADRDIGGDDLEAAALYALDAAANIVAGCNSVPGRKFLGWATERGLFRQNSPDPAGVAFLLGSLCHILEVDDLHRASVVHPGCVVVPVLFAYHDRTDSGVEALSALLWGFEAATRVGMAVGPQHYRIWHNTATCGPFGAALAACRLRRLDVDACVHALGNAGTQAAGLWEFLDTGAESKHLHAGHAAQCGVMAADLAAHGLTGAPQVLEGERGFFRAMCPDGVPEAILAQPDAPWQVHKTSIKPWPSCRHTHPTIDAALEIADQMTSRDLGESSVRRITIDTYQAALNLCDRATVDSDYAAKFSLQHCVAAALSAPVVGFAQFGDRARGDLASLRERVEVVCDTAYETAYPTNWGSAVSVEFEDGSVLKAARRDAKGDPEAPLGRDRMIAKAAELIKHGGINDPAPLIDGMLAMAEGGPMPDLLAYVSAANAL
jgi:2-methylcitrate dehydratase PrpD